MEVTYLFFHIILACVFTVVYILLKFYIIPELVQADKQTIAMTHTDSGFTAMLTILAIGSLISNYIASKPPAPSGGKRR